MGKMFFSIMLDFGGYEPGVLEDAILTGPVEMHMEITKKKHSRDGNRESGFLESFLVP